jgi:Fe-S-cluster containining protein
MATNPSAPQGARTPLPLVRLDASGGAAAATADIRVGIGGHPVHLNLSVPAGPALLPQLLPVVQGLADVVVDVSIRNVEQQGEHVSCKKGCAACCRQLVQVSESEARALARLVDALPAPRQAEVRARFAAAAQRLADAGLLDRLRHPNPMAGMELPALARDYFQLHLACPFLEDECCTIHPERPVACREYLVTSPAENCSRPTEDSVRVVPLAGRVGRAVRAMDKQESRSVTGRVFLVLALEWAAVHPEGSPPRPGMVLLQEFFGRLAESTDHPGLVADWLPEASLRAFLTTLGWVIGYDLGDDERGLICHSVADSDSNANRWYQHEFQGWRPARVQLARVPGIEVIRLRAEAPPEVEPQLRLALAIFQQYPLRDDAHPEAGK